MATPSKQLKLSEVVKYIKDRYSMSITRQSIYNWTDPNKGWNHEYIRTTTIPGPGTTRVRVTTSDEVDQFLQRASLGTIVTNGS